MVSSAQLPSSGAGARSSRGTPLRQHSVTRRSLLFLIHSQPREKGFRDTRPRARSTLRTAADVGADLSHKVVSPYFVSEPSWRVFPSQNEVVRLLGYTRVSTSSQDAQLQVDAFSAAGVQKRDVFADVTSGSKTAIERRGMKKLLEYAQDGDTVVVWRVDRLGRSLIDVLNTVNLLRERGVQVRSISDGIDPSTSTGRLMLNMLATLAEYERELIVERVNAACRGPRERDPLRPAPVGSGGHRGQARDRRRRSSPRPHR